MVWGHIMRVPHTGHTVKNVSLLYPQIGQT